MTVIFVLMAFAALSWGAFAVIKRASAKLADRTKAQIAPKPQGSAWTPKPDATPHLGNTAAGLSSRRREEISTTSTDNGDYSSGADYGEHGKILRRGERPLIFDHVNRYGEVKTRMLTRWVEYPVHIHGFCDDAGVNLTFNKTKIYEYHAETNKLLRAPKGRSRQ